MMDIELLKNHIQASTFADWEKRRILEMLPKLGPNMQAFLDAQMFDSNFHWVSPYIFERVLDAYELTLELEKNDFAETLNLLTKSIENPDYDFGRWLLPWVLDVKQLARQKKLVLNQEMQSAVGVFELKLFRYLPFEEVVDLLGGSMVWLVTKTDALLELKRWYYYLAESSKTTSLQRSMLGALEDNEESLGTQPLVIEGRKFQQSIKNWIHDFLLTQPKAPNDRATLEEVQYMQRSQNVKLLSKDEQQVLLAIIKLYDWILAPELNEAEFHASSAGEDFGDTVRQPQKAVTQDTPLPPKNIIMPVHEAAPLPVAKDRAKPVAPMALPARESFNVQDMLAGKLAQKSRPFMVENTDDQVNLQQLERDNQAKQLKKQQDIDKKLEQLKMKIKK